ncbi:MAG: ATP-binding protein [bacterium]
MSLKRKMALSIESKLDNVSLVGTAVSKLCSNIPLSELETYQVELCVVEACNNAIEHAYKNQPGHVVEVDVEFDPDKISFAIVDTGNSLQQACEPTLDYNPKGDVHELPEGGMGLYLIKEIMDKSEYTTSHGKNKLTLTKYFDRKKTTREKM